MKSTFLLINQIIALHCICELISRNFFNSTLNTIPSLSAVVHYFHKHLHDSLIFFLSSLGTGVTSKLSYVLTEKSILKPKGYILEAPFNCMKDEVESFKASKILTFLGLKVESILNQSDMSFDSALWLPQIKEPVLILHAKDDEVIPFDLAEQLYKNTKEVKDNIEFVPFEADLRLRHDGIYKAIAENPKIVTDFVNKIENS